jgi:hypothetical protein
MIKYYILFIFCFLNFKLIHCQYNSVDECIQMVSNIINQESPDAMNSDNTIELIKKKCEDATYNLPDSESNFAKRSDKASAAGAIAEDVIKVWNIICDQGYDNGSCDSQGNTNFKYGCYKGYCWSGCYGGCGCVNGNVKEWCWTGSRGFGYKTCTQDSDCNKDWACAGTCSV